MAYTSVFFGDGGEIAFDVILSETHSGETKISDHPVERGSPTTDHVQPTPAKIALDGWISSVPLPSSSPFAMTAEALDLATVRVAVAPRFSRLSLPLRAPVVRPLAGIQGAILSAVDFGAQLQPIIVEGQQLIPTPDTLSRRFWLVADYFDRRKALIETLESIRLNAIVCLIVTPVRAYSDCLLESWSLPRDNTTGGGAGFSLNFKQVRFVDTKIVDAPKPTEPRAKKAVDKGDGSGKEAKEEKKKSALKLLKNKLGSYLGGS